MISVHDISLKGKFVCEFCNRPFSKEASFLQHRCKQMERYEALRTQSGQLAWNCYKFWLKIQKRNVDDVNVFIQTGNFVNFCKFAEWALSKKIEWEKYISLMVKRGFTPGMWLRDDVIAIFLNHIKTTVNYREKLIEQLDLLLDLAEQFDVDVSDLPSELTSTEVYELVRRGLISIVFVLFCPKFKEIVANDTNTEHIELYDRIVVEEGWNELLKNKQVVEDIKQCLRSINLL